MPILFSSGFSRFKFGDLVYDKVQQDGTYMVVGPYIGARLLNDEQGDAVWVTDIDTAYSDAAERACVWIVERDLELIDG